ncbi:MAG TPA: MFS transporter [Xanthobacteraceae bacterium]|nr:MFS transporter [Xanthobacteraceae bacterium]
MTPDGGEPANAPKPLATPSRGSLRGLDWFVFFVADVQTGFGPFIAVYLTTQAWTQGDIGLILSVGGLVALMGQMPGGAIVDAARSEKLVAGLAVAAIGMSALAYAAWPAFPAVLAAAVLHSGASCVLGPCIGAISLGLVGHGGISERLGRNARFASIGNGLAAAAMGACGYFLSNRAVFIVTALLVGPALLALSHLRASEIDPKKAHGGEPELTHHVPIASLLSSERRRTLMIFAACMMMFHLANAAMLPLMGGVLTMRSSEWAPVMIAACIVVPQLMVALISPWVGRRAQQWGRRPLLLIGFAALPVRGVLFAIVPDPNFLVAVQLLDGISAAMLGVMGPLIVADITRDTGRFNLAQGIMGTAIGIGASISTTFAGQMTDHFGSMAAFLGLAGVAAAGLTLVWALMPETRPTENDLRQ